MPKSKRIVFIIVFIILSTAIIISGLFYAGKFGNHFNLKKTTFANLPGWQKDNHVQALVTFRNSCVAINKLNAADAFSKFPHAGQVSQWQAICRAANNLSNPSELTARQFFENWFEPYIVSNNFNPQGLFTGYYLPLVHASLIPTSQYNVPIYALPFDLVKIKLKQFRADLPDITLIGQLHAGQLHPYPDRAAIYAGTIKQKAQILLWGNSLIDEFFMEIQGSGIVQLPNGQQIVLGYAGSNGQPYTAIGKVLLEQGALDKQHISLQTIKAWLMNHPQQVIPILTQNRSYGFFKILKQSAPLGSEQVSLTPMRSLAVDTSYIPLGAPIWLSTTLPAIDKNNNTALFQHLLIAQDTGGAIKGIVRGDIYWGAGAQAELIAGHMQNKGRYWILLPRNTN